MDDDVAAAVDRLRRERHVGVSTAINELVRAGLNNKRESTPFKQESREMRARVDVTNVWRAIEAVEGDRA